MYGLMQVEIMIGFIFLYAVIASIPILGFMAVITKMTGDKSFFKRIFDNYSREQGWKD